MPVSERLAVSPNSAWFCCVQRRKDQRRIRVFKAWIEREVADTLSWLRGRFGAPADALSQ